LVPKNFCCSLRHGGRRTTDLKSCVLASRLGIEAFLEFSVAIDIRLERNISVSRVLVQRETYEGFGLAQLEAMSVRSNSYNNRVGAVTKVVADCCLYCDKDDLKTLQNRFAGFSETTPTVGELTAEDVNGRLTFGSERRRKQIAVLSTQPIGCQQKPADAVSRP